MPLILYIINIYFQKIKPNINFWLILSIVLTIFLTPRIYLFVFIFGIYFFYKNNFKTNLKSILILIFSLLISFLFFFDLYDIFFFVFVQSKKWSCSFILGKYEYFILAFNLIGLITSIYQKRFFIVFSYLALFFTFFLESAPFRNQSTLFLTIITIYILSVSIELKRKHKYFQTRGFGKKVDKNNKLVHPIFIMNYSYFSFSQPCILEDNFKTVVDYNLKRNRKINYFKSSKKLYYINPKTKKLFKIIDAYEKSLK